MQKRIATLLFYSLVLILSAAAPAVAEDAPGVSREAANGRVRAGGSPAADLPKAEFSASQAQEATAPESAAPRPETFPDSSSARSASGENAPLLSPIEEAEEEGWKQGEYPGVKNACLQKNEKGAPRVKLWHPVLDVPAINAAISRFLDAEIASYDADAAEVAGGGEEGEDLFSQWELSSIFFIERPSDRAISVVFNTYRYSGGAHGNISVDCLNFDLASGKLLTFQDLFADPAKALALMSELSAAKLTQSLGEDADEEMIREGTAPEEANFRNLALAPDGLNIEFQPYQVGPWSIGPQRVKLDLAELAPARPSPEVWNLPPASE